MYAHDYLVAMLAVLVTASGMVCLYLSWRCRIRLNDMFTASGWLLLACAALVWIELAGVQTGLVLAGIAPALVGLFTIAINVTWRRQPMVMRARARAGPLYPGTGA